MFTSQDITLSESLIKVKSGTVLSFGGSQLWFRDHPHFQNRRLEKGGCGLIAVCDLNLFLIREKLKKDSRCGAALKGTYAPASFLTHPEEPLSAEDYLAYVKKTSFLRYPIFPKAGSFSFEVLLYMNYMLKRQHDSRFCRMLLKNTKKERTRILKEQLQAGNPVILIIGQHFLRFRCKKGVNFYKKENGRMILTNKDVFCHYVTVTGLHFPKDSSKPMYLEISSWGRRYYIDYEELDRYIRRYSTPWFTTLFYLTIPEA